MQQDAKHEQIQKAIQHNMTLRKSFTAHRSNGVKLLKKLAQTDSAALRNASLQDIILAEYEHARAMEWKFVTHDAKENRYNLQLSFTM